MAISIWFANADLSDVARADDFLPQLLATPDDYLMKFMMIEGEIAQIVLFEAGQLWIVKIPL